MDCDILPIDDLLAFIAKVSNHMMTPAAYISKGGSMYERDDFDSTKKWINDIFKKDKNLKIAYEYICKREKFLKDIYDNNNYNFKVICDILKKVRSKHSNSNPIIFEGVQIPYLYRTDKSLFNNSAFIIKAKSTITSVTRRTSRDGTELIGGIGDILGNVKMFKDWHKDISDFRNNGPITEAVDIPEIKPKDIQYINGTNGVSNSYIDYKGKHYRVREEVYLQKSDTVNKYGTKYKIPGGSAEAKCDLITQASNECKEESKLNVKNIYYTGKCYLTNYRPGTEPSYQINYLWPLGFKYAGSLTYIYIAEYNGHYHGYIRKADRDDLYKYGKFYDVDDIKWLQEHKQALDDYFKSHTKI